MKLGTCANHMSDFRIISGQLLFRVPAALEPCLTFNDEDLKYPPTQAVSFINMSKVWEDQEEHE